MFFASLSSVSQANKPKASLCPLNASAQIGILDALRLLGSKKHLNALGKLAAAQSCRKDGSGVIITHGKKGCKFDVKRSLGGCPAKG